MIKQYPKLIVLAYFVSIMPNTVCADEGNVFIDYKVEIGARISDERRGVFVGKGSFNPLFTYGELEFRKTKYGDLKGRFALMPPEPGKPVANPMFNWHEKIITPLLNAHESDWPLYGLVYLYVGRKLVIRCHVGGELKLVSAKQSLFGTGTQELRAEGRCADHKGELLNISFGNMQ